MRENAYPNADAKSIVYVREADRDQLPEHLRAVPGKVFTVHDLAGNCLAISPDRRQAFALARRNDLNPVSVH